MRPGTIALGLIISDTFMGAKLLNHCTLTISIDILMEKVGHGHMLYVACVLSFIVWMHLSTSRTCSLTATIQV